MCDPVSIGVGLAVAGAGTSLYGMNQTANAQKAGANAIKEQNISDQIAQTKGFNQRLDATNAQTQAQKEAWQGTLTGQQQVADAMREGQSGAISRQQDVLGAVNDQEGALHETGMRYGNDLLDATSGANLGQAQTDWQHEAAHLLDTNMPGGGDSGTEDDYTNAALTRRAAEAASNIRQYGSRAAKVASYRSPLDLIQNANTETATGIMPAAAASKLLQSSAPVMLAPSEQQWTNVTQAGQAGMSAVQQQGQTAQNIAGLQYANSTDIANLNQSNATVTADNISKQAQANAAYKAAMGNVISGIGNLGLQGAGYYGKLPGFLDMNKAPTFVDPGI